MPHRQQRKSSCLLDEFCCSTGKYNRRISTTAEWPGKEGLHPTRFEIFVFDFRKVVLDLVFDSIAEPSQLPDHFPSAHLRRLFGDGGPRSSYRVPGAGLARSDNTVDGQ